MIVISAEEERILEKLKTLCLNTTILRVRISRMGFNRLGDLFAAGGGAHLPLWNKLKS